MTPAGSPPPVAVVAVDGGNSKTDMVLAALDGTVLARHRGPGSSPQALGLERSVSLLSDLIGHALNELGDGRSKPLMLSVCLAGLDLPEEEDEARAALSSAAIGQRLTVHNDTFAVLRAGLANGNAGVAVVCGAGINAVGRGPDGVARFLAIGAMSGDWGGGLELGLHALGSAVRYEDGRGPLTRLGPAVAAWFDLPDAHAVAIAMHRHRIDRSRLVELAPLVVGLARQHDPVAALLVERCAQEVTAFASAAAGRIGVSAEPFHVILGGSMLTGADPLIGELATALIIERNPLAQVELVSVAPVVGAALLGFDELGVSAAAEPTLRKSLPLETVHPN
jgi:N-acetylglucosamine kinase-like BadF-type ATPase